MIATRDRCAPWRRRPAGRGGRAAWTTVVGYVLFVGMMATGYFYNITFVQLGLVDLGTRLVGLAEAEVAAAMAAFALSTSAVALLFGLLMQRRGWGAAFVVKLRLALGVAIAQALLTGAALLVRSEAAYLAWIAAASVVIGLGVPVTFGLTVDLVPVRWRGAAGGLITATAYVPAVLLAAPWTVERFALLVLPVMLGGVGGLVLLLSGRFGLLAALERQHLRPSYALGRFVQEDPDGGARVGGRALLPIGLMFGVFFVDSLGFLRLTATPLYMQSTWHAPELAPRLQIAGAHLLGAFIAGVLYAALDERRLFPWIFGTFALVHLTYTFHTWLLPGTATSVGLPQLYALAVSIYTVVGFALWADLSTPRTIGLVSALGVALSGWTATFLSTALAMQWRAAGFPLEAHFRLVGALAILFFLASLLVTLVRAWRGLARAAAPHAVVLAGGVAAAVLAPEPPAEGEAAPRPLERGRA